MANPTGTVDEYCGVLTRSRLMPAAEVSTVLARWRTTSRTAETDVDAFRKHLVANRYLTDYQAALIQRGHADGFFIGGYVIVDRVGRGQSAGVYKAVHPSKQVVALKVLPGSKAKNPNTLARFQREGRLLTQLNHPNVVRAFQVGNSGGVHFIVMEYLEGETLADVLGRVKKLPAGAAARLIQQAFHGLDHLHDQRMVHRDLKPANLMLVPPTRDNDTLQCTLKVLDIGLGREMFDENSTSTHDLYLTTEGAILGTPDYLAPEQARDARGADIRADIYSLGCVLFHLLAGRPPFVEQNVMAAMVKHATEPPPDVLRFCPSCPPGLKAVLEKLLAKDPAARYQTPVEAAVALRPFIPLDAPEARSSVLFPGYERWLESESQETPIGKLPQNPRPSLSGPPSGKIRVGVSAAAIAGPPSGKLRVDGPRPKPSVSGPPSGKIKMGGGLAAAVASAAASAAAPSKPQSHPPRPSPLPPTSPNGTAAEGDFDVELINMPSSYAAPADLVANRMPDKPIRPLYDLDRRDFIMLSIGAGGVLGAIGFGLFMAKLGNKKLKETGGGGEGQ